MEDAAAAHQVLLEFVDFSLSLDGLREDGLLLLVLEMLHLYI